MPLTMLKWTGSRLNSYVLSPLPFEGPGICTPKCETTEYWQCCFRGDEQRHRGCWDPTKGSQEARGGCSCKNNLKMVDNDLPPCKEGGEPRHVQIPVSESKGRALLCGCAKSHPWGHRFQLCATVSRLYTPPEKLIWEGRGFSMSLKRVSLQH